MAFVRQNELFSILKMRKISLCSLEDLKKNNKSKNEINPYQKKFRNQDWVQLTLMVYWGLNHPEKLFAFNNPLSESFLSF